MSVVAAEGFRAAGVSCGIKPNGRSDLAVVATVDGLPVSAAGVFTSNRAAAAPVQVSRRHLDSSGGRAAAVVLSSGNANAATGERGRSDARLMAELAASSLGCGPEHVLVCSTGLIGFPMPTDCLRRGVPAAVAALAGDADGAVRAAEAIMTTDTVRKEVVVRAGGFTVGGMAKGAAMLAPDMATMLAVLTTDAAIEPGPLAELLRRSVSTTFNRLSVDGATSTNDTVIVLASGRAGPPDHEALGAALTEACSHLAGAMAEDAEGATKVAVIKVTGATGEADALAGARKIAESQLVQASLNGGDPYWGRVVSELGSAGIAFDIDRVTISYGGTPVCRQGVAAAHDEAAVAAHMAGRLIDITADLGLGAGEAALLTTDLSHAYIDENRTTS